MRARHAGPSDGAQRRRLGRRRPDARRRDRREHRLGDRRHRRRGRAAGVHGGGRRRERGPAAAIGSRGRRDRGGRDDRRGRPGDRRHLDRSSRREGARGAGRGLPGGRRMSEAPSSVRPSRWPWILLGVFFSTAMAGAALVVANDESLAAQVPYILAFTMFGTVGAVIVSRDRSNRIGLMLLYAAVVSASSFAGGEVFTWLVVRGHTGPAAAFLGFLNNFGWLLGILPVVFILPLIFPDGHLPSPRWRPFLWLIVGLLAFASVSFLIGQRTLAGSDPDLVIPNPFFVRTITPDLVIGVLFPLIFLVSIGSLFLRFRRATGIERQQIKWVAFGVAFAFVTIIVGDFVLGGTGFLSAIVGAAGFMAFPVSIGIAVLRLRLYDLDIVVRKAVVAGVLAVFVGVVYAAVVAAGSLLVGSNDTTLAVIAAVLLALAFQPVRVRARRLADRLVYGRRANPYEVLTDFSARVGGAYATEDIVPRMAQILGEGAGSDSARVWLRVGKELRPGASWPSDGSPPRSVPIEGDAMPRIDGEYSVPVRDRGELLGALSVTMPANDPMTPAKARLD